MYKIWLFLFLLKSDTCQNAVGKHLQKNELFLFLMKIYMCQNDDGKHVQNLASFTMSLSWAWGLLPDILRLLETIEKQKSSSFNVD